MAESSYHSSETTESAAKGGAGAGMAEGIIGIAAVALAIIGLANVFPVILVAVATVAIGVAFAFEGGTISARYAALSGAGGAEQSSVGGGVTAMFLSGLTGITLGILSLIGINPLVLIPISAIAFGAALVMDSSSTARLAVLESTGREGFSSGSAVIAEETARSTAGLQILGGVAAITLGILALIGIVSLVLSLVAMLIVGAVNLLSGAMVGSQMVSVFRSSRRSREY